jgi:hypothetical protein
MLKPKYLLITMLFAFITVQSQNLTWMSGSTATNQPGVYGTMGVPSTTNIPGARSNACTWTDAAGNFWLYGGSGHDAFGNYAALGDLWKYIPSTNSWAWMNGDSMCSKAPVYGTQGVSAAGNKPGARWRSTSWIDASNNLWLFGGVNMCDVWKYSIANNEWTWVTGSQLTNQVPVYGTQNVSSPFVTPGPRYSPSYCADPLGNLWLFGGNGALLSDLWKFTVSTGQWTWVKGTSATFVNGVYGTMGTPSATILPGGRMGGAMWEYSGELWLFGGNGMDAVNTQTMTAYMNDMWKYNIGTGLWTWVRGSSIGNQNAICGAPETFSTSYTAGARVGSVYWKDSHDKFWLFGGAALTTNANGYTNDLWKYDPVTDEWGWMQGSQQIAQNGAYGTQGVPSIFNAPGSRIESTGWIDLSNDIWVFGGYGLPQTGMWGTLNDLWKYSNCSSQSITVTNSPTVVCSGSSATISVSGGTNYFWSTSQTGSMVVVTPSIITNYSVITDFANGCVKTFPVKQLVNALPSLFISASANPLCLGTPLTLTVVGSALSYTWNGTQTGSSLILNPTTNTSYSVIGADLNGCMKTASINISVVPLPTVQVSTSNSLSCAGEMITLTAFGANTYSWINTGSGSQATVIPTNTTTYTVIGTDGNGCKATASILQTVDPCTGVSQQNKNENLFLNVYPNPSTGNLFIELKINAQVIISDLLGREIFNEQCLQGKNKINLSEYPKGIYLVSSNTETQKSVIKIVLD